MYKHNTKAPQTTNEIIKQCGVSLVSYIARSSLIVPVIYVNFQQKQTMVYDYNDRGSDDENSKRKLLLSRCVYETLTNYYYNINNNVTL